MTLIKHKNARILWNVEIKGTKMFITDFTVAEFDTESPEDWPDHLYKAYNCDIGNCQCEDMWSNTTPAALNHIFFAGYDFEDQKHRDRIFRELMKIEEYNQEINAFRSAMNRYS